MKGKGFWILGGGLILVSATLIVMLFALMVFLGEGESPLEARGDLAVVTIDGPIIDSQGIVDQLGRVEKNDHIRGLILRIDSPGGGVGASQEIYQAVKRIRKEKKVIATMGGVAASGGYYIAVAADKIVANPGTITGSIGVLMDYTNVERLLDFLKIHAELLTAGKMKDVGSPLKPLTEEDRAYLNSILENMHEQFKKTVQEERGLDDAKMEQVGDGRIFTGQQALQEGLVDQLGNQQDAVDLAKEMLGIEGEPKLLYPKKKKLKLLELLADGNYGKQILKTLYMLKEKRALYLPKGIF